jgi:putative addiction module killer protein
MMPDIMDTMIQIKKSSEFIEWYESLRLREQVQIDARIDRIKAHAHFGDTKYLSEGLYELRWANGWRVYFYRQSVKIIIILYGGSKNGQEKDIRKARILLGRYANFGVE